MRESATGFSFPEIQHRGAAGSGEGEAVFDFAGNLLRRQPGSGGRWFTSQYGTGSSAGQWTKLATVSIVNGYNFVQFEIAISQGYTGRGGMRAIVSLAAAPSTGFQTIQLRCIASDKASSRLVAVRTKNYPVDGANEIELWWQTDSNWLNVSWSFSNLLIDTNCTMTPTPSGGGWVASPSAGTQYPAWSAWMADELNLSTLTPNTLTGTDANDNLVSYSASAARALIGAAPLDSPAFTGTPTVPTAPAGTNTLQAASTAFVRSEIANLVGAVPGTLDTLDELAQALGDDPNFAATMATSLAGKQPLDPTLTALAGLATGPDQLPYSTGSDTFAQTPLTSFARTLLDDTSASAARSTLGAQASLGFTPVNKAGDTMTGALTHGTHRIQAGTSSTLSEGAEVLLASGPRLCGQFQIKWSGAANREIRMLLDVAASNYTATATISVAHNFYYGGNAVIQTLRVRRSSDSATVYLTAVVSNLNGGTSGLGVGIRAYDDGYTVGGALPGGTVLLAEITNVSAIRPHVNQDQNVGTTLEGAPDPFHQTQRFTDFDRRGGVRTWNGIGPFAGTEEWYNVVDVMHRNGGADGASGYGGILAWGMLNYKTRLAFASRAADGSYSWTEVWTKAEISDSNMPRLDGNNAWTGENTFFEDLAFRSGGFDYRSGPGGSGYGSGGFFAKEYNATTEPYVGVAFSYSGSAVRTSLGLHPSPNSEPTAGFQVYSPNEGFAAFSEALALGKITLTTDAHIVDASNVTMTKMRAIIISAATRNVTLPSAGSNSIAIIQVKTSPVTKHRVYPPSGSFIFWHDFAGVSRATDSSGVETLRLPQGMYWFLSDGTDWTLMGPASNT